VGPACAVKTRSLRGPYPAAARGIPVVSAGTAPALSFSRPRTRVRPPDPTCGCCSAFAVVSLRPRSEASRRSAATWAPILDHDPPVTAGRLSLQI